MRVRHPADYPPAAVDVNGARVTVDDDGTFEIPDGAGRSWAQQFATAYDVDLEEILIGETTDWHGTEPPFDPGDLTVDELDERLGEEVDSIHDAEVAALYETEEAGKNRSTALEAIESHYEDSIERHHSDGEE